MRCTKCNHELDEYGICPNCYNIQDVQTMSNRESNHYDGVTIEDENNIHKEQYHQTSHQQSYHQRRYYRSPRNGFKVRYINLGSNSTNWLTRGLIAIGGIAILGFFFFIALPILLTVLGAGIVAWLIFRFFKR